MLLSKMAETSNVHNALETLNIAEHLFAKFLPVLPDEHSCQTNLLRVKLCLRKIIAEVTIGNGFRFHLTFYYQEQ